MKSSLKANPWTWDASLAIYTFLPPLSILSQTTRLIRLAESKWLHPQRPTQCLLYSGSLAHQTSFHLHVLSLSYSPHISLPQVTKMQRFESKRMWQSCNSKWEEPKRGHRSETINISRFLPGHRLWELWVSAPASGFDLGWVEMKLTHGSRPSKPRSSCGASHHVKSPGS